MKGNVAALFVSRKGHYYDILGDDLCFDERRDARTYAGPFPIVAHPPCERWGRYWGGGPSAKVRRALGDDGGLFQFAFESVIKFGGVIEHPEGSHAFRRFGIDTPRWREGWIRCSSLPGHVCCVAQGNYGHQARKLTWLYTTSSEPPELDFSIPSGMSRLDIGFHSAEERRSSSVTGRVSGKRLTPTQNIVTPREFAIKMIEIAMSCAKPEPT